jgi:hypothetical protein
MNLLLRISLCAFAIGTLFALTTVPVSVPQGHLGAQLVPTPAWAGGSPDETLNPPSNPSKSKSSPTGYSTRTFPSATATSIKTPTSIESRWIERGVLVWRFYLTSVLRF